MLMIQGNDIRDAAIHGGTFHRSYESFIPSKEHLQAGFGIEFQTFGDLGNFLVSLGSTANYNYNCSTVTNGNHITPDDARSLANDLQIDPLGSGLIAYFPGWELTDD